MSPNRWPAWPLKTGYSGHFNQDQRAQVVPNSHLGGVLLWPGRACCGQHLPPNAAALETGQSRPAKETCCLNTPWFLNCPSGAGITSSLQHSASWVFCTNIRSPTSLWAEVPYSDLRGIQICLSSQLLKQATLILSFITDVVLFGVFILKHHSWGGCKQARGST